MKNRDRTGTPVLTTTTEAIENAYTRREIIRLANIAGMGAVAFAITGCSPAATTTTTTGSTGTTAPVGTTVPGTVVEAKGGVLQFASEWFYPGDTLDPGTISENGEIIIAGMLYQGLTSLNYSWEPQPLLAESWEINDTSTEFVFHLREAGFHDGSPLTSADVAFSIGRLVDEAFGSALYARLSPSLSPDGIEVVDERTLRLSLLRPDSLFLLPLSTYQAMIVRDGGAGAAEGIGTGPFRVKSFNPGTSYEFERHTAYWRENRPLLDGIRIVAMPEEGPKVQSVLAGDSHLSDMNYVSVSTVEGSEATILESASVHLYNVAMDVTAAPFDDQRVRKALKIGMDRQRALDIAYSGFSETAHDVPAPDSDPFVPASLLFEQDIEEAKRLLAEAGYPDGIELELQCSSDELQTNFALAYSDALKDAGITIKVSPYPAETYWDDVWLQAPFFVSEWFRRHPIEAMSIMLASDAPWNESKFKSEQLDSLIQGALTVSGEAQKELTAQALNLVAEESGLGIPGFRRRLFAAKPGLTGLEFTTFTVVSFENVALS